MTSEINLNGKWVGDYIQFSRAYPISATLIQVGDSLTGTMRDAQPEDELSISEVATESGQDERIVAQLEAFIPEAKSEPIQYFMKLAPESFLEGWIRGRGIYFDKSYRGTCYGGFKVGDQSFATRYDDHVVHYSGRVTPEGEEIEGRWWIGSPGESRAQNNEGSFILRRLRSDESI